MEYKYVLGVDPGTGSLGLLLRDTDEHDLMNQVKFSSVDIIRSGVIESGQNKYTSFAAERRGYRSARNRYMHIKWRKQATLKLLIDDNILDDNIKYPLCPLSKEDLERWIRYDKKKGLKREYPVHSVPFIHWLMMDFDGDGKVDGFSSPYQIRKELLERQFDFSKPEDCLKLGRALYHIAQKRGFRSSKGTKTDDVELPSDEVIEKEGSDAMEYSEKKKSKPLSKYMDEHEITDKSVGYALAMLENEGARLRDSEYQVLRKDLKKEIKKIFEYQHLSTESYLYTHLISEKKGEGTIFYQRRLRSQRGKVEKCTFEPLKKRCKVSHPEFEKYRAWSLINNIKIQLPEEDTLHTLPFEMRQKLYKEKFSNVVSNTFRFASIRRWIEKELGLTISLSNNAKAINYDDNHSVGGCPTIGRLQRILGDNWESWTFDTGRIRKKKNGTEHQVQYDAMTLWHVCSEAENETFVEEFANNNLPFNEEQIKELVRLYKNASDDYSKLSLNVLKKINYFLERGFGNYEATLLANIPSLIGVEQWKEHSEEIEKHIQDIIEGNREKRRYLRIVNSLIADYKSLDDTERFADKQPDYQLQKDDYGAINKKINEVVGKNSWERMAAGERLFIMLNVTKLYQQFFNNSKRTYYTMPADVDSVKEYLNAAFGIEIGQKNQLFAPTDNKYYPKAALTKDGWKLCSPVKGANHNPAAMRILFLMRRRINKLLNNSTFYITPDNTRVVVELPRELNDANMRKAIDIYKKRREKENQIFVGLFQENTDVNDERLEKTRLLIEQCPDYVGADFMEQFQKDPKNPYAYNYEIEYASSRYRLWLRNRCIDLYSGQIIPFAELFNNNQYDIDHTIPRSKVLQDGLDNKTITSASFNRRVKHNKLPSQLTNYHYVILPNLQPWIDRVAQLEARVEYWLNESKKAGDSDIKNYCIVQRHLWQMELDYWKSKLERFTITEVTSGFVSKQMVDTRVISKYVFHYLKSFFGRVDVQYGSTTATFRKIYGLPPKDRTDHTHHAIDAAILTLIPTSAQRDAMLSLFYKIDEENKAGNVNEAKRLIDKLEQEKNLCLYGSKYAKSSGSKIIDVVNHLRDIIMVNHVKKDQTFTSAKKRGFIKRNGQRIDINKTGDSIRGQIHKDSFFGAIKPWETDDDGNFLRDEQGLPYASSIKYVMRYKLQYGDYFNDWEDLEKRIVDKSLYKQLRKQAHGLSFKDACAKGFYVSRKVNGVIVKNKIRHVRCYIPAKHSHVPTKKHIFTSGKEYKQYYYAQSADLPYCCEYKGNNEVSYVSYSLYDISMNMKDGREPIPNAIQGKREKLYLSRKHTKGDMVVLYKESEGELIALDDEQLAKRLYMISGFENSKGRTVRIKLVKHNYNAAKDKEQGKSNSDFEGLIKQNKIKIAINKVHFVEANKVSQIQAKLL